MLKQRVVAAAILLTMLLSAPLSMLPQAASAAIYCGCGKTGNYVTPAVTAPKTVTTKNSSKSPKGTYAITATPTDPTTITVTNVSKSPNQTVFSQQISGDVHWYFSPDDTHLVLDVLSQQLESVFLYDLASSNPGNPFTVSGASATSSSVIGFSSKGKYVLYGAISDTSLSLKIFEAANHRLALNQSSLTPMTDGWGFSPDEDRFIYVSAQSNVGNATLYDLTKGNGQQKVWTDSAATGSSGYSFSPKGHYLLAASVSNGNDGTIDIVDTTSSQSKPIYSASFTFSSAPLDGKNKFGVVGWGFSPADSGFVYAVATGQAPSLTLVDLTQRPAASGSVALSSFNGSWWKFSPCGDVLGVVAQTSADQAQVTLFEHADVNLALASQTFNPASLSSDSLKTTDAGQVVHAAGNDLVLKPFDSNCNANGSGNGNGNGGTGNGNGSGNGSGTGNGNGTGGSGKVPVPTFSVLTVTAADASPPVVVGGTSGTVSVTSTGTGQMTLTSSNTQVATVAGSMYVIGSGPSQVTDVPISTTAVTTDTIVTITVTGISGAIKTTVSADLVVIPPCDTATTSAVTASSLTASPLAKPIGSQGGGSQVINTVVSVDPVYVSGGGDVSGTVTVLGVRRLPGGMTVSLVSSNPDVATVPDSVTIPAGSHSASFTVQTNAVAADTWVSISATLGTGQPAGAVGKLLVLVPSSPTSVSFDPSTVTGGDPSTGTITLGAPPLGCSSAVVQLTSSNPNVVGVPGSVTIPTGATTAQFAVTTTLVTTDTTAQVTASDDAGQAVGTLTVDAQSSPPSSMGGTVLDWGRNNEGELGIGTTSTGSDLPVAVSGLSGVISVAGGDYFSVALENDGTVWAWGNNGHHQLGDGTTTQRDAPVQVQGLPDITAISARRLHTLALAADGTVWAWGENGSGQLGDGTTNGGGSDPLQVQGLDHVVAVAAGGFFSVALKDDGTIWAWGSNDVGQLGDGTTIQRDTPVQVTGAAGTTLPSFAKITAGYHHVLAVDDTGNLWAWGGNENGTLGIGSADSSAHVTPVEIDGISNVTAMAAYYNHSVAVSGGLVYAWGDGSAGELGDGTSTNHYSPTQVPDLSNVVSVAVGGYHTVALTSDGTMYAWGASAPDGRLGDGTDLPRSYPVQVLDPSGTGPLTGVISIAAGDRTSMAIVGGGS